MKNISGFTFQFPTEIVFGKDAEMQTPALVHKYGGTKVMIILGSSGFAKQTGLLDRIIGLLDDACIAHIQLKGVQPNPRLSLVYEGLKQAKRENVDVILAIGGGSVTDTAKAIAAGLAYDGDIWDFCTRKVIPERFTPLGAITTISGSGSETSGGTVILDDIRTHHKYSYKYAHTRASFAIMNPELAYTVSPFMTGAGAADIFAHGIEGYFTYGDSHLGDKFCESVMGTAVKYGPIAVNDPTNYEARAELMLASSFAHNDVCRLGRSLSSGGVINLERHLSGSMGTVHGAGTAVVMPAWFTYMIETDETTVPKIAQCANRVFGVEADPCNPREVAREGINRFRSWLKELGMPLTLHELLQRDVSDKDVEEIVNEVHINSRGLMSGFGHCTREDVWKIFQSVR